MGVHQSIDEYGQEPWEDGTLPFCTVTHLVLVNEVSHRVDLRRVGTGPILGLANEVKRGVGTGLWALPPPPQVWGVPIRRWAWGLGMHVFIVSLC